MAFSGSKVLFDGLDKFKESIEALKADRVLVGIPAPKDDRKENEPIGNAAIGFIQENGSPLTNIPARPFLVPGVAKVQDQVADHLGGSILDAFDSPKKVVDGLTRAGIIASNSVKATLTAGEGFDPLAASTLAARRRKGFKGTKPLIETAQLRNSITYVLRNK